MTREWKDTAIILRYGHFHENDLWLKVILSTRGLQTLFAFGGAKSRRRFCGCLDLLNTIDCLVHVSRNGEYMNLAEATLLRAPLRLRTDWRCMGMAANCARFVEACAVSPENASESLMLLENMRERLEKDSATAPFFPLFFRLRLASTMGFAPAFTSCALCGKQINDQGYFQIDEGRAICADCDRKASELRAGRRIRLTSSAASLLNKIQHSLPVEWNCANSNNSDLRIAGRIIDSFIQFHLGLAWENGNFRRI